MRWASPLGRLKIRYSQAKEAEAYLSRELSSERLVALDLGMKAMEKEWDAAQEERSYRCKQRLYWRKALRRDWLLLYFGAAVHSCSVSLAIYSGNPLILSISIFLFVTSMACFASAISVSAQQEEKYS